MGNMISEIDLHMHTSASDGTNSPSALLAQIRKMGIRIFSCTDHDTIDGVLEILNYSPDDIRFIPGVEFSCKSSVGKCHILGCGIDCMNEKLIEALETGRRLREEKLNHRLEHLRSVLGISMDENEIKWLRDQNSPGKPHIGRLLVAHGLAKSVAEAIKKYLDPIRVDNDRLSSKFAIDIIQFAGGVPVWAHPLGGEGERHLTNAEFQTQLHVLLSEGIRGMECWYSRYAMDEVTFLTSQAQKHQLLISGGSDYHGISKPDIHLGQLNSEGIACSDEQLTLLKEVP